MVMTPEEAFNELLKAQTRSADSKSQLLNQIVQEHLPYNDIVSINENANPATLGQYIERLGTWSERFPNTAGAMRVIEPTENATVLGHYRNMFSRTGDTPEWALGIPTRTPEQIRDLAEMNQGIGWYRPSEIGANRLQQIMDHEFGHAIDDSLTRYLQSEAGRNPLLNQYLDLKSQLVQQALEGNISGYAKSAVGIENPLLAKLHQTGYDLSDRTGLAPTALNEAAKEPLAEKFSQNPGFLEDIISAARGQGWKGEADLGTLASGAATGGALLAAPIVANAVGGRLGAAINGASTGAALGSFAGPEGALIGGGIGALASQFLK